MAYTVALPDGRTVEFPDSVPREKAAEIIRQQLGGAAPESGGTAAFKAGLESLKGSTAALLGKTGIMDIDEAAKYQREREAEAQRIYKPTEQGWTEAPLTKLAELGGGSLPYMLAPIAAGAATAVLPLTGAAATAAGLGATGLASLAQFTGTNLARQIEEGKTLQQTELAPAALAALPQAALDVLPLGYIPGVRQLIPGVKQIFAAAGKQIPDTVAEQIIKQGTVNTLKDYGAATLKSMGAEGITEASQQFFERLQAGLSLTDEKARDEYWQNLVGGAVLGGALAPAGRYVERGQIADRQAKERRAQEAELVKQQVAETDRLKAEQEAYKQTPDFLKDVSQRWDALQTQLKELDARASAKPAKNDLAAQADVKEARQERDALKKADETQQLVADYRVAKPRLDALKAEEEQARITEEGMQAPGAQAELFGVPTPTDRTPLAQIKELTPRIKELDDKIKAAQKAGDTQQLAVLGNQRQQLQSTLQPLLPSRAELNDSRAALERYLADSRERMKTAETSADIERHAQQAQQYKQALDQLDQYEPHVEAAPDVGIAKKKLKDLQSALVKARELGDQEQVLNILPKLKELEAQTQPQLFEEAKAGTTYAEPISDTKLAEEMAAGRERAKQLRESLEEESAKLRAFAERKGARTPAEQALFDLRTDEARRLRDQFAKGEQDWANLKQAPEDTQYHQDRLDLQKSLKDRVVDLQMELDKAPEAPVEEPTFEQELAAIKDRVLMEGEKPQRFKQDVQKELDATQQSLADLERRIAIGERYRKKGEVAQNIITKETDARVNELLDRLLPGAIKPPVGEPAPAPRRIAQLPIQSAQDQLTRLKDAQSLLKSLNKQIQAAGKPKDPAKVEALDILKVQRKSVQREVEAAKNAYNRLVELEQPGTAPAAPAQADLFGGLEESRAEINSLDKKLTGLYADLKKAVAEANRLGAEAQTPQLKELVEKFQKRPSSKAKEIQTEIERLEARRESATGKRSALYDEYLKERAAAPTTVTEEQLTFDKRLSGIKAGILKPVAKDALDAARTKYVDLQTQIEGIRSAISKQDSDGGKALREAATALQKQYEDKTQTYAGPQVGFKQVAPAFKNAAEEAYWESIPSKVKRLLNMANMAAAAKKTGNIPKMLQAALEKAQTDRAKAKEALDALEAKQRAYEQQQAVITGATPGEAEAKRLLAGEGYRTAEGFLRTTPKKKESWGITSVPKTKEAKPTEVAKAAAEVEKAKSLIAATAKVAEEKAAPANVIANRNRQKLARLEAVVAKLDPQANDTFAPEKSTEIYTEIQALQEEIGERGTKEQFDGLSAIVKGADLARAQKTAPASTYIAPFKRFQGMMQNAEMQVKALESKLNQLKEEYDTINLNEGRKAPVVVENAIEDVLKRTALVDKSYAKAVLTYKVARRDMLAYQYEMGKDVREQYRGAVQALQAEIERQGKDATLPAAIKERDTAVAKLKETQERLAAAETKLREEQGKARARAKAAETLPPTAEQLEEKAREERRQAILRGESAALQNLPSLRVERDTTSALAQAVQNNAKRMLGLSRAALESATNAKEREEATLAVQRYERELAEAYSVGERKVTTTGEYAGKADIGGDLFETQPVEPGKRLSPRKEGPLVRKARQAPGQFLGAALDVKQGATNPPRQAGAIKLRAADLNPEAANAISLTTLKGKLDAAKDGSKRKATLEDQYKLATEGLTDEQIRDRMAEGQRLLSSGETLEVIAANEKRREARLELVQAESYLRTAKTPAAKEIAQDDVDTKQAAYDAADRKYEAAKTAAAAQGFKGTEQADAAVEEDLTSTPASRLRAAIEGTDEFDLLPTTGSATATPLSTDALGELYNGSLIYSLNQIAKSSPHPFIRDNATKLSQFIRKTKVEIVPELFDKNGKSIPAAYSPSTNTVRLTKAGLNENDVIHEVTHAATMSALVLPDSALAPTQVAAKRELTAIFNKMRSMKRFKDEYASENLKEFVSEVQSNPELRQLMDKQPWYKGTIFEGFINAVLRLVGVKPADISSAKVSGLIDQLYMQSRTLSAEQVGAAARIESAFIGREAGKWDSFKGNLFGLAGRVQLVDRLAAADKAIVEAEGAGKLTSTEAFQTQYFMRMADQTTQAAGQFITYGPVKIVAEKRSTGTEYRYQSEEGANLMRVSEFLGEAAKAGTLSPQEAERMLTSIIAGERASSIPNGWARLQTAESGAAARAEYDRDVAYLKANPAVRQYMDAAKDEYKRFNDGLVDFVAQCGAISKEDASMFKGRPYVPFYRVDNDVVKLFTDSEHGITIGNIKDNPDLQRMMGDNKHILPVLTSAAQNAFMLTRMGLQNQATKTTADAMHKAGFATKIGRGSGPGNVNTVHYKIDGKPAFAVIDADTFGIPAHLIVKGMEGIKTTIPALVQMMGVPADILRRFVTRTPAYAVRQLIRDPVNSFILSGVDGVPVLNALKEMRNMRAGRSESEEALMRGLAISSNVYSGNEKDMQKFLQDIASGKGKWEKMLGWMDTMALQADAATRATIYQDSLNKGLSEAQAQFRALESQNFSRRGLSPSMQMLSTMIPFFNAQIQGLDVLYRSMRGRMPFSERLEIQRKIAARGVMLTTVALAYALAMQDDDAYKKASPEERYNNFFVHIPGVKDPLKVPIPYEVGILFKALPEAILDAAMRDTKTKEAALGMGKVILQSAPGVVPIAGKPLLEMSYGQTSMGPIESQREKQLQAEYRYRETTTEVAKALGSVTGVVGVSPIMLEHLVRGYTGSLGLAAMHTLDPLLRSSAEGQKASLSAAQQPFIGGLFQPEEGRWLVDRAYDRMDEVVQAQKTFNELVNRGQGAEARAFAQRFANQLAMADDAGSLRKEMGELFSMERAIRANPNLTTEQKDLRIEQIKKLENKLAEQFVAATDRTIRR